jgi:hypothetical protein
MRTDAQSDFDPLATGFVFAAISHFCGDPCAAVWQLHAEPLSGLNSEIRRYQHA